MGQGKLRHPSRPHSMCHISGSAGSHNTPDNISSTGSAGSQNTPDSISSTGSAGSHNTPDSISSTVHKHSLNSPVHPPAQVLPVQESQPVSSTSEDPSIDILALPIDADDGEQAENTEVDKIVPPLLQTNKLKESYFVLPNEDDGKARIFIDRKLPATSIESAENSSFPSSYFVSLHERVSASGPTYSAGTPNYLGARIPLQHCKLKVDCWRYHLQGYEGVDICQMIEFGFPMGLALEATKSLKSTYRNHGSSYQYYKWWDKMTAKGVSRTEISGPCTESSFINVHCS